MSARFEDLPSTRPRARGLQIFAGPPDAEWLANAQGEFDGLAPAGRLWLEAKADAYSVVNELVRAPANDILLVMAPGANVRGRVQRIDASPVQGAAIGLQVRGRDEPPLQGHTDERGEFVITGVRSGVIEVTASALGLASAHEWLNLNVAEAAAPLLFTLESGHSIRGLVSTGGHPCAGGIVLSPELREQMADIDEHGRYQLDGLGDGDVSLTVKCGDTAPQTRVIALGPGSPAITELDWVLDAGFSLAGSLHRPDGTPVVAEYLALRQVPPPEGGPGASLPPSRIDLQAPCETDSQGEFECRGLAAGWYRVSSMSPEGDSVRSEPVRVDTESKPHVALVLPATGEIRVRVAGASSNASFARGVFAHAAGQFPIPAIPRGDENIFRNMPLGHFRITLGQVPRELGPSAVDVELSQAGQVIEVALRAPDATTISGSVIDANGSPVPDAWVRASLAEPGFPSFTSVVDPVLANESGVFELVDVPPGRYALTATHALGEARQVDVAGGQRGIRLVLEAYGALAGSVTAPDGEPAARFSVLLFRDGPSEPLSVAGQQGAWSAPWLGPGDYRVIAMASTGSGDGRARVTPGQKTELSLTLQPLATGAGLRNRPASTP